MSLSNTYSRLELNRNRRQRYAQYRSDLVIFSTHPKLVCGPRVVIPNNLNLVLRKRFNKRIFISHLKDRYPF
jgi:hypothetical protein